jgi:hypothetical protein
MRRGIFVVAVKYLLLVVGIFCAMGAYNAVMASTGLGIAAAGCFIAFALIEINDVREANKE